MLKELVPFQAEAAWTIGDWDTVAQIQNPPPIAEVFLAIRQGKNVNEALSKARRAIGSTITTREYTRAYDAILQLHMLREVEMIYEADRSPHHSRNAEAIVRRQADDLVETLSARFGMALPVFRVHEEVLNKRRAAFSLMQSPRLRNEQGQAWIQSAKIARKAGYEQTAYSAALQAKQAEAPFAFIQAAKLVRANNDILKGLRELTTPINDLIKRSDNEGSAAGAIDLTNDSRPEDNFRAHNRLAKVGVTPVCFSNPSRPFSSKLAGRMRQTGLTRTTLCVCSARLLRSGTRSSRPSSISVGTTTRSRHRRQATRRRRTTTTRVSTTTRRFSVASSTSIRRCRVS